MPDKTTGYFSENRGQYEPSVTFIASTEFGRAIFLESMVQYSLEARDDFELGCDQDIVLTFPGSSAKIPEGLGLEPHHTNYLIGDQGNWILGVQNYRSIIYQDLWPGIDLVYSFSEKGLKYEYRIDPFVDESIIKVKVDGAEIGSEATHLTFVTEHGPLFDGDLVISEGPLSSPLEGRFISYGNEFTYKVEGRDWTKDLTIDPLVYSTYIGGTGGDYANSVAVDSFGNVYVTGYTASNNFPTSVAYQASINGSNDAFVFKLSPDGGSLLYSTYIGGSANDVGSAIAVDSSGNAYVTGFTSSTNFPTSNPIKPSNSGSEDAFVLKLSPSGGTLIYSTYMGGSGNDRANGIALDGSNNAYIAGTTSSTNFPTLNAYQSTNKGSDDAFAFKINSAGSALTYSTYVGGADEDYGNDIAVDGSGNAFIAGGTSSTNFPTANAYQSSNHGFDDAFLLKLGASGNNLLFSTYLGGVEDDTATAVTVGTQGNAYLAGSTYSTNFPTRAPYQASNAGGMDAFVVKMGASGSTIVYSTYIGGSGSDPAYGIALDSSGLACVVGRTSSTNFPTIFPYQGTKSGGLDAFELKLNLTGGSLIYSTFIGGSSSDVAYDIAIGPSGAAYVCGYTQSTNFPTSTPYQSSNGGSTDAFILKVEQLSLPSAPTGLTATAGTSQVALAWQAPASNGGTYITKYRIYRGTSPGAETYLTFVGNVLSYIDTNVAHQAYYYKVAAENFVGQGPQSAEAGPATPTTVPDPPANLAATPGSTQLVLTWNAPANDGGHPITNYRIYRGTNPGGESLLVTINNALTYTDTGLTNGQTYYYVITAINSVGQSRISNEVSGTPATVPTSPQSLAASPAMSLINLNWATPSNNGGSAITGYKIYRGTSSGGETLLTTLGNILSYSDIGLTNGQIYYYKVSALNSMGEGAQSSEVSATPGAVPSAPQSLNAIGGVSQVTLNWSVPSSNGGVTITAYKVYRGTSSGGETLLTTLGNVLTYTNTGLTNGQTYYYRVSAVNGVGEGPLSNEASATPMSPPSAPTITSAVPDISQVVLVWTVPADNGGTTITGYKLYRGTTSGSEALLTTLGNVLTYTDTGLTNGQVYYYKVSASNSLGEGALSNEAWATPGAVPSAPQGLTAIAADSRINLTWSAPSSSGGSSIDGYRIYRGTSPNGETLLATLGGAFLSYNDISLTNGQTYYYKVSAVNIIGEGPLSNEASATPVTLPTAPRSLTVTPGNAQVSLTWSAPANNGGTPITGYKVHRGTVSGGETLLITLGNVLAYTDMGLANGQTYYYMVSAVNGVGEGPGSNEASATPVTVPTAPQDLIASAGNGQIALTWSLPASTGGSSITGYKVYRGMTPSGEALLTTLGNALSYLDESVINGLTYYYRVSALNGAGESALSNEASASPRTLPNAPTLSSLTPGDAQISLSWTEPSSNGGSTITAYKVYRGTTQGGETPLATLGNVLSYLDVGLTNGQTYYYKVSAVNDVGEGALSNEASAIPVTVPTAPSNLVAVRGNAQIALSWSAPSNNGGSPITGYKVFRGTSFGGGSILTTVGNVLTYTDIGLTNGQIYYYKLSAINSVGEGALSNEASATPATVPSAPQSLTATSGNAQVVLGWSAPSSNGGSAVNNYKIYRGTIPGGEALLTTLGNVLTFTDVSLNNGQTYYYKVSAMNGVGEGAMSIEVSATPATVPTAPQGLTATSGNVQVFLAWSAPSNDGGSVITGYNVYRGTSSGTESLLITLGNVISYIDTAVTNGQIYYYKVSAANSKGESSQSNEASVIPATVPSAPSGLTTTRGNAQMTLAWNMPSSSGGSAITGYKVYRGTAAGGEVFLVLLGNTLSYVDTGLINGQTYYYKVSAVNGVGEGPLSNEASARPATVPTAPQNLEVVVGNSQVRLTWSAPSSDGGSPVVGYKVYQGTSSGGESLLATLGNVLTYTSTGLINGQTYYCKVSAWNAVGEGAFSAEASAVPATTPSAPTITSAVPGNAQVALGWSAPSSDGGSAITGYKLYRGTTSGGESFIASIGAVLTYTDAGLTNGQVYYYQIKAANVMGEGSLSDEVSATPVTLPTTPLSLLATSGNTQVSLSWSQPASNGGSIMTGYKVYRGTSSGGETLLTTLGNVLTYTNTGLTNGQTYYYRVSAVNGVGEGPLSNEASATPSTVPSAPRGLQADAGDGFLDLNWTVPAYAGPGTLIYHLFRDGMLVWSGVGQEYADGGLTNGATYSYKVAAQNSIGWGENSSLVQATPRAVDTVPTPPRGLAAIPGNMLVDLNWTTPYYIGPGTLTYHLFRDGTLVWSGTATSYHDAPLAKGTQLSYKVAAQNSIGWGANCTAVLATPLGAPDAPWGLVGVAGDSQASLIWNASNYSGPGTLTYHLFRDRVEVWSGTATQSDDIGLSNGLSYAYKVASSNSMGWSANSSSINVVPRGPPSVPRGLQAVGGDGVVVLNWTSPSYVGPIPLTYHLFRDEVEVWSGSALFYVDAGLSNGQTYLYNVAASNPYGWGSNSSIAGATPQGPPTSPYGLKASPGDGKVLLNWTSPSYIGPGTLTYHLLRDEVEIWSGMALSHLDSGISNGQSYAYKVAASNSIGWSAFSSSIVTIPEGPPSVPRGLVALPGNGFVELNWTSPIYAGPGVLTYQLYRNGTLIWSGQGLAHTDSLLVNGATYLYKVGASNDLGRGANSSEVSATPLLANTVPSAPRDLVAVAAPGAVDLSWAEPSYTGPGTLTYHLFREGSLIWSGTELSYHDAPLAKGVLYSYKVAASNSVGWGSNGSYAAAAPFGPPDAPWGLNAVPGNAQASLRWSGPNYSGPGDLVFHLFRDDILLWSGTATNHIDDGLTNGQIYIYKVAASNSIGWSSNSSSLSSIPQGPPSAPKDLKADSGNGMVQLNWAAPDYLGPGSLTYHLYRNGVLVWSGIGLVHSETGLANFVTYTFILAASNYIGLGPNGTAVQVMPLPDEMTPSAPYGIEVTEGNGNLTLVWDVPIYSNASSVVRYVVYYGMASSSMLERVESINPSCVIDGLEKGRAYHLVVAAENNAGLGPNSSQASGTPFGTPSSPSALRAEAGDAYVLLSWTAPAYQGPGPMTYHLYRDSDLIWTGADLGYNDTSLNNGVAYRYQVMAQNSIGRGAMSEEVSATPVEGPVPPSAPVGLDVEPIDRHVTLTWSPPAESGSFAVIGYKIYRGESPDGLLYLTSVTATSYSDGGLTNGKDYYYQVSAYSEAGEGPATEWVHAVPTPDGSNGFDTTLLLVLVMGVVVVIAVAVVLTRRRR